jgi:poly-gamma-glutamate synthesis protein (capsule biosynthesis protein)
MKKLLMSLIASFCVAGALVTPLSAKDEVTLSLLAAGDVMVHSPQVTAARTKKGYDFTNNYTYVKGAIKKADLAMMNIETPITGKAPEGYPTFNGPTALARDLHKVGFDVAFTSNNHMMDQGYSGTQATLRNIRRYKLTTVGSRLKKESSYYKHPYVIKTVKGVKIGLVAYTYNTSRNPVSVNGIRAKKASSLINTFNESAFASHDYKKIQSDIKGAKKAGAKMVIVYYHWGIEYKRQPNSLQKSIAKKTADMGADVILASHPHVLEPARIIKSKDGRQVPVFYSMGNYISNQRGSGAMRYRAEAMMAKLNVSFKNGKLRTLKCQVVPTWVDKYASGGRNHYKIIDLTQSIAKNPTLKTSHHQGQARTALKDITALMGKGWIKGKTIKRK